MNLSAEEFLKKFSNDPSHAHEVRRLAMMIFDEVSREVFEMSSRERLMLGNAALLHDIGYYVESKSHNKHSQQMILENGLEGFNAAETRIIACTCRYHRGSLPDKEKHEIYCDCDKKERKIIKRLGGIVRLADGLDTAHQALIKKIKVNYDRKNNIVEFYLTPNAPAYRPDITAAIRKRDLFEVGFKTQSVIKFSAP